jgi:rod shape-determining protein MreD
MLKRDKLARVGRGRVVFGFVLIILMGFLAIIIQGMFPEIFGIRIEWLFIFFIYVGIYKSPGLSIFITATLGLIYDLTSSAPVGQGFFCAFYAMGVARIISSIIYVNRPGIMFLTTATVTLSLNLILLLIFLISSYKVGSASLLLRFVVFSSFLTALISVPLFSLIKYIDPERGGYYLTRFMREEKVVPLL